LIAHRLVIVESKSPLEINEDQMFELCLAPKDISDERYLY